MVSTSIFRGSTLAALLTLLSLTSCATSESDVFALPVTATTSSSSPVATSGSSASAMTAATVRPAASLRAFVGEDADRLGRELGAMRGTMHASDHFVFVATTPMQAQALPHISLVLEQTRGAFFDVFGGMNGKLAPIKSPLVWMVFDGRQDYERYAQAADGMDMSWSKAYYSTQTNRVAIALSHDGERVLPAAPATTATAGAELPIASDARLISQITHEAGHQLAFNSGLQTRGVMYPLWASEGLAANFEMDSDGRLGPTSENALRSRHLTVALAENRLVPLDQWVGYTRVPIGRPAQINAVYSQSWAFFRFLYEHHQDKLHDYLAHMAKQEPGRRSEEALHREFVHIFGNPQELVAPWNAYLAKFDEKTQK